MEKNPAEILQTELEKTRLELKKVTEELEIQSWGLKKTNEGVRVLYKELEKKNEQLKKMDQLKSQFVANVSHEFKNPLSIIKESLEMVLQGMAGAINADQQDLISMATKNIKRLLRLVMDLLDVSKIEAGKMQLKRQQVDAAVLVNDILKTYEREFQKKEMTLETSVDSGIGLIWADADKLSEVLINLVNNAIKYTPAGGKISVKLEETGQTVRFEISDSGPGIPKDYLEKVFDKFERIMTEKQEGTGLGLPIAKDIVELHGGKIWLESQEGKGSNFIFILPKDLRQKRSAG